MDIVDYDFGNIQICDVLVRIDRDLRCWDNLPEGLENYKNGFHQLAILCKMNKIKVRYEIEILTEKYEIKVKRLVNSYYKICVHTL